MRHNRFVMGAATAAITVVGLWLPTSSAYAATSCSGAFTDDPTTKTRSLNSDCVLTTTWAVDDGWTLDGNGHTITADDTGGSFTGPIIESASGLAGGAPASMTVQHLTINATNFAGAATVVGILFDGAKGGVSDVHISGVSSGVAGNAGYGLEVANTAGVTYGATDQVKMDNGSSISGYQRAAVYVHANVKFSVFRSVLGAPAHVSGQAVAGVLATSGSHGAVKENQITLADTEPASPTAFGAGVQLVETRRVEVRRNLFTGGNADFGVSVANPAQAARTTGIVDCNLFQRSDSSATDTYGVAVGQWADGPLTNVALTNSTFVGNWKRSSGTISGTTVSAGPANTVDGRCPPSAPTNVLAAGGNHRSQVTWGAALAPGAWAPLTGYVVQAKATGVPTVKTTAGPNATSALLTGLSNKHSYVVTVTAQTNGGAASGTTLLARTKLSLTAKPGVIHRGDRSTLHGTLSSADPKAKLAKRKVTLWAKPKGGHWAKIATMRTTSKGAFAHTVKPRRTTAYKVVYAGRPDLASSHKTNVRVRR